MEKMFELAHGVKVQEDTTGAVYSRPPDRRAIEYLVNRACGCPTVRREDPAVMAFSGQVTIVLPENFRDNVRQPGIHELGIHQQGIDRQGADQKGTVGEALDGNTGPTGAADAVSLDAS